MIIKFTLFIRLALFALIYINRGVLSLTLPEPQLRTCEPIRVKYCTGLGYNVTGMPNFVGHEIQNDAEYTLQTFSPLIQYGCSARLLFFLCSVYVPMCTEKVLEPIGPCRGLCESVRSRCFPVLQGFGFTWPAALNCSNFPLENNHEHMCMEGPKDEINFNNPSVHPDIPSLPPVTTYIPSSKPRPTNAGPCGKLAHSEYYVYINRTGKCAARCEANILFNKEDKKLAEVWLTIWASLCFISSLATILSFLVDSSRFKYPERPIAFLALCYNLASVGWGVRAAAGRTAVACHISSLGPTVTHHLTTSAPLLLLSHDGLANANCAVVFLLLYYFGMAATVWWVVLAAGWFFTAGHRISSEKLARHSSLGHLVAWGLPAAQTVAVLVLRDVDADELTGACYVGNQSTKSLLLFVLIPYLAYLTIGCGFLMAGLISHLKGPKNNNNNRSNPRPLLGNKGNATVIAAAQMQEEILRRVGILTALYTIPLLCIVTSLIYEYLLRDDWLSNSEIKPSVWVFILRLFMSLIIGVTSAIWIWSNKTITSWKRIINRIFGNSPRKVVDLPVPMNTVGSRTGTHRTTSSSGYSTGVVGTGGGGGGGGSVSVGGGGGGGNKFHHTHTHHHHHHHPRLATATHHKSQHRTSIHKPLSNETTVV